MCALYSLAHFRLSQFFIDNYSPQENVDVSSLFVHAFIHMCTV